MMDDHDGENHVEGAIGHGDLRTVSLNPIDGELLCTGLVQHSF